MKIGNKSAPQRPSKVVVIPKVDGDITLTIQAFPLGFEERVMEWLPQPVAPRRYAMKAGKVLKDERGVPVLEMEDRTPEHLAKVRRMGMLQGVALLHESLRGEKSITWETPEPPEVEKKEAFYSAIYEEMKAANLTTGDVMFLLVEIKDLSLKKYEHLRDIREGFSSEASS